MKKLHFQPLPGLSSNHLQTIIASYRHPGAPPPTQSWIVSLDHGDFLSCEVSCPPTWNKNCHTVVLVHGLGGSHNSSYMIRMARKLYEQSIKAVRINLRGCGTGQGLSKLPYNAGNSEDLFKVIKSLKLDNHHSDIIVIGFSLGGNMVLKLAGELGQEASKWVKKFIAVCAPLNLEETVRIIEKKRHKLYHYYYLKEVCRQGRPWIREKIRTLFEFDDRITAPLWGYSGASDYYFSCSSMQFLPHIKHDTHLLLANDDPFIPLEILKQIFIPSKVDLCTTDHGGHMGFLGKTAKEHQSFWMDEMLLQWIK